MIKIRTIKITGEREDLCIVSGINSTSVKVQMSSNLSKIGQGSTSGNKLLRKTVGSAKCAP